MSPIPETAVATACAIARGELSAREVVRAALDRIEARDAALNCFTTITAERAYELGLVNSVTEGPAIEGARALAKRVAANGPLAVIASKGVIRDSWLWSDEQIIPNQTPYIGHVFSSEDAREGATATLLSNAPSTLPQPVDADASAGDSISRTTASRPPDAARATICSTASRS